MRVGLVLGLIASTVLAGIQAPRAQPPSVSAACATYEQYFAALRTPVPPTVIIGAKTKALAMVKGACDQPSHAPDSALKDIAAATNMISVTIAHYPAVRP